MSYIRQKTGTYAQVIQSKTIADKVMHMPLERVLRYLESTIVLVCARVLNQVFHRLIGCYHFYAQAVDNYGAGCIA